MCLGLCLLLLATIPYAACQCSVADTVAASQLCDYEINGKMELYTNGSFTDLLDLSQEVASNSFMYLRVEMFNASHPGVNLLVESCWASQNIDHVPLLYNFTVVEFPGCPIKEWKDIIPVTNNALSKVVTVEFPIFYLYPDSPEIFFHCSIGTCDNCLGNDCDSPTSVPRSFTRAARILTLGPIKRDLPTTPSPTSSQNSDNLVIIVVAVVASILLIVLVILIAVCLCYPKWKKSKAETAQRNGNAHDPNETS